MQKYYMTEIAELFTISEIVTIFYRDFSAGSKTRIDQHDFWEIIYTDRGNIRVYIDEADYLLVPGQILFYKPNAQHWFQVEGERPVSVAIISFVCNSPAMSYFETGTTYTLDPFENQLFSNIISEGSWAFEYIKQPSHFTGMCPSQKIAPTTLQLVKVQLEHILLRLFRRKQHPINLEYQLLEKNDTLDSEILNSIKLFIKENISSKLTVEQISRHFCVSPSFLKVLFKNQVGCGVIEYSIRVKIERAKHLLRTGDQTITQISDLLGFYDVHHFSKMFKAKTGMNPSDFAKSIRP